MQSNSNAKLSASQLAALTLGAIGVVYGDIGTSPLYAVKETFNPQHGIALTTQNIVGGVSAIFWALMIIVTLKYVTLILRASNRGEGGIMALLALATGTVADRPRWSVALLVIGVFGAALFYGDAVLTPAICKRPERIASICAAFDCTGKNTTRLPVTFSACLIKPSHTLLYWAGSSTGV
mgnify:CR=1 FL=1